MIRRTLGQIKAEIARVCGSSGMNQTEPRVVAKINEATEELIGEGDWAGVVDRYMFNVTGGTIFLPQEFDRIVGVALDDTPYSMRSAWYEFVEYGPGPQSAQNCAIDMVLDRDDSPISTVFPATDSGPWGLFVVCEEDERTSGIRPKIEIRGRDSDGKKVRYLNGTSWLSGEPIELNGDTPDFTVYGTALWSSVEDVIKPETKGNVELWATNGTTTSDVLLATYEPLDTCPTFRTYYVPSLDDGKSHQVLVRARKRFVPVVNDSDVLIISNLPALKAMVMAIYKREISDIEGYANYKATAIDILKKESLGYRGKTRAPAFQMDKGAGLGADIGDIR